MDQLKLEAAIQFGTMTAFHEGYEDKDLEEMREIFEKLWADFQQATKYGYFTEYLQDYLYNEEDEIND